MNNFFHYTFFLSFLLLAACHSDTRETLPILGSREAVIKEINGTMVTDTIYKTIPNFTFLNQDSLEITNKDFENSIYIADFFFTSCPSICPIMHRNMLKVYHKYEGLNNVKFLSHSIDFKYDTPSVLKAYADKLGVSEQWQFASGTKEGIYGIANDYLVFTAEDENVPGGYEHQGWFVLIDKERRIRGAYDGTDDDQVRKLLNDIPILLAEYERK